MTRENPQWTPKELARMKRTADGGVDPFRRLPPFIVFDAPKPREPVAGCCSACVSFKPAPEQMQNRPRVQRVEGWCTNKVATLGAHAIQTSWEAKCRHFCAVSVREEDR